MAPTASIPQTTATSHTGSAGHDVCDPRRELSWVVGLVREVVGRIDPDELLARHAPEVWDLVDEGAKLFVGAQTRLARRVDDSGVHKTTGAKNTAEYLALRSGVSNQAAADMLATSKNLPHQPSTEAAVRSGELSAAQAHRVSDAARTNPTKEQHLLDVAKNASIKELRDEALRAKHEADPDPEATRRRHHRDRCFRQGNTADGGWWFSGRGTPEDAGRFNAALNPLLEDIFREARDESRHEPRDAYAYDALLEMARRAHNPGSGLTERPSAESQPAPGPAPAPSAEARSRSHDETGPDGGADSGADPTRQDIGLGRSQTNAGPASPRHRPNLSLLPVLRLDLPALHRGHLAAGELCEITSLGPVSIGAARGLLEEAIVKLALSNAGRVVSVTHIGRAPPNPTHLAILHADMTALVTSADGGLHDEQTCTIPGLGTVPKQAAGQRLGQLARHDLLDQVLARGRDVATLVHPGRQPTVAQRVALLWTQPTCSVAGCPHTFTQIDHRHEWYKNQVTELANLDRLCPAHHRLKTHENYQLTPSDGTFLPSSGPTRHQHDHQV